MYIEVSCLLQIKLLLNIVKFDASQNKRLTFGIRYFQEKDSH